jgi:hypothetical protein
MLFLLVTQVFLGFAAFLTRVVWGPENVLPQLAMLFSTVAHVALGALLLTVTAVLTLQVWRHVPSDVAARNCNVRTATDHTLVADHCVKSHDLCETV